MLLLCVAQQSFSLRCHLCQATGGSEVAAPGGMQMCVFHLLLCCEAVVVGSRWVLFDRFTLSTLQPARLAHVTGDWR